jgi:hypothetical protein
MKNILGNSNFGFSKWCVALIAAGWMGTAQAQDIVAGWDFQTTTTGGTAILASTNTQTQFNANVGTGVLYLNGTEGSSSWVSASELNAFAGTSVNATNGLSSVTTSPAALAVVGGATNSTTPTPPANGKSISFKFSMTGKKDLQISLSAQVQMWPTVTAREWKGMSGRDYKGTARETILSRILMPSPTTTATGSNARKAYEQRTGEKLGQLTPEFCEWLMGFPIGWTELNASETQSFHNVRKSLQRQSNKLN